MSDNRGPNPVLINKYPNRRYYDTLNSRHVTLQEVHDLIISGKDVCVTDTRTGEDLTIRELAERTARAEQLAQENARLRALLRRFGLAHRHGRSPGFPLPPRT